MKLFENMSIKNNILYIANQNTVELAKQYGTPLFVMDAYAIKKRCQMLKKHFTHSRLETEILYASKAFCSKAICQLIEAEGLSIDVVSGGELYTAIQSGYPANRIYFHGNNKSFSEIKMAVSYGIKRIIVDNLMELEYLVSLNCKIDVLIRVNPGIEAHTHDYIQTAKESSKFGISFDSKELHEAILCIQNSNQITLKGFHCHIGSQIHETAAFEKTAQVMLEHIKLLEDRYTLKLTELNLGGGFGVYYADDQVIEGYSFLSHMLDSIDVFIHEHKLSLKKIMIEPGRLIMANAGVTLYEVGFSKETISGKKYLFVDGGMTDNIRPALYQAKYEACIASEYSGQTETYAIAGKCCESGDILIDSIQLPISKPGAILAVMSTGAYGYSMANNYNRIPRPAVILLENNVVKTIIKRESYDDLIQYDL